ncbi:MAG: winged helix-turn-helix domain-containing tetratricopeptide repeat protein [Candidatus Thiodiazotropha endolucinida]
MASEFDNHAEGVQHPFRILNWNVDPVSGYIGDGQKVTKLEPKVMAVLAFLARQAGEVVTREELEQTVWAGRVVSYDALTRTIQKLRKALQEDPRNPRIIETLPKRGYRLIVPVESIRERAALSSILPNTSRGLPIPKWTVKAAIGLIFMTAMLISFLWIQASRISEFQGQDGAPANSIAVLPFINLSRDSEQYYFSDGLTDDLITSLARNPSLFVISRDSSFIYKGEVGNHQEVAKKLNVRYILSGSVRKEDDQIRINAQLTDTESGNHIWGERYSGEHEDIFILKDKITDQITIALAEKTGTISAPSIENPQKISNPEAYDYFLHGRNRFFQYANKTENQKARELYLKALELDSDFALAYAMLAWTYAFESMNGWSNVREDSLKRAKELAAHAIALDETTPVAYFISGLVHREQGEYIKAAGNAQKAIDIDPNYANAYVLMATLHYYNGRPKEGLVLIRKAMRLNPHYPYNYPFHLGQAYYILQQYEEAINAFQQGLRSNPNSERMHVWLAAAYAQFGLADDADWEVEQVLLMNPHFSIVRIIDAFPFNEPEDLQHFVEGLKKAGFPH